MTRGRILGQGSPAAVMSTIESDRNPGAIQTIAAEILGHHVGVSQSGRLGNEIVLGDGYDADTIEELRAALGANGHGVEVTRED